MKKLYSLVAIAAISTGAFAQGTETLDAQAATAGSAYTTVNFTGADDTSWAFAATRMVNTTANYAISGTSALLNANGTATITFGNGIGTLNFDYRKAFTGASARSIQVSVNGTVVNTTAAFGSGSGAQTTVYKYSFPINKTGSVVVEVKALDAQITVDNFSWTQPTLAVIDADAKKVNFIKNTVVDQAILFGTDADVKIYSVSGQLVKSIAVKEGQSVDVSNLAKGIYIVAGEFAGQKVTKKITKK